MDWTANVAIHESASPEFLRERILSDLGHGRIHPHLLYAGLRQATLWTALHRAFSPAFHDEKCIAMYEAAFHAATNGLKGNVAHVVSLACGDGSKDIRCLQKVRASKRAAIYTPVDISLDLVLSAARSTSSVLRGLQTTPLLCDLQQCSILPAILKNFDPSGAERLLLFLGTIHNFWPPEILRSVLYPLRLQDQLLISANLVPADAYEFELQRILPQYDNQPTRDWLMGALSELRLTEADGELHFSIQPSPIATLKRIEATFHIHRTTRVRVFDQELELKAGTTLAVFFSHRFTTDHIHMFLEKASLKVTETWQDDSGYEGLFLCRRSQ